MIFEWLRNLKLFRRVNKLVTSFGRTDTGRVRANNEDSFAILADHNIFLVADGMGGHNSGEVASRVAIESLVEYFSKAVLLTMRGNREYIHHCMVNGLRQANEKVIRHATENKANRGMGCTLVAAFVDGDTLHTCHVGDARCYWSDGDRFEQVTTDHTLLAKTEAEDPDTGEKRKVSRHVVTRAMGFPFLEDPEYHVVDLPSEAKVLLCSDGLWSMVEDSRLQAIMYDTDSPEEATDIMVREANEAGGKDNITALVVNC